MQDFREAAVHAIEASRMEPIYFATIDPQNFLKSNLEHITELLDGVKSCDIFLGLYGQTLDSNWTPEGYFKHSMEWIIELHGPVEKSNLNQHKV